MDRGTYIAASAGIAQLQRLEVVNNNLANINTPAYKKETMQGAEQDFSNTLAKAQGIDKTDPYAAGDHKRAAGVTNLTSATDFSMGAIKATGNPLDVALRNEKDFFMINTPKGTQYTRAGNFTLVGEGVLSTQDGLPVSGDGGDITAEGPNVSINQDGSVESNGKVVGRLQVARFEDTKGLKRVGDNRFEVAAGGSQPEQIDSTEVVPASLEMANISAVSSMVEMISAQRGFQMYTKAFDTIDTLNQTAINQIGRRAS